MVDDGGPPAQPDALGRLLVIQYMLDTLPDAARIGEFVGRALLDVPGIDEVRVCVRGRVIPADSAYQPLCARCEQVWNRPNALDWLTIHDPPGMHYFPLRTLTYLFGFLAVRVSDPTPPHLYLKFLGNITNVIGRVLESALYQAQLTESNAELRRIRDELEIRVAERTRELTLRNNALLQEIEERTRLATALEQRERQLYDLAYYDQLTGLLTQRAFVESLSANLGTGNAAAVVAIAIDQFGRLCDAIGYRGTDEVLKAVSRRLRKAVAAKHPVARARGERFYVGFTGSRFMEELEWQVRAMMEALGSTFTQEGQKLALRFRIGIACYPADAGDLETLMQRAEAATHLAPDARSRNRPVYYRSELAALSRRHLAIEECLHEEIVTTQFFMVYQPRVSVRDGKTVGAESLLRWQHPELGAVSPGEFIPIAEECGAIGRIGAWVMRQVCAQIGAWKTAGAPLVPISINLTMHDVLAEATIATLVAEARAAAIPLNLVEVEITESTAMLDVDMTKEFLGKLRDLGVRCIIDDFGTGYSSLAYLADLPFSSLKIDKRFVDRVQEKKARSLIQSLVAMARSLKYGIVAEGVEYAYQAEFLRAWECDEIQGYLYSRPLPAAEFLEFVRASRAF